MTETATASRATAIPIVNVDSPDAVNILKGACQTVGFFYLEDQSLSALADAALQHSQVFFDLPQCLKQGVVDQPLNRGYTGYREETLDSINQSVGDTKEGFYIGRHQLEADPSRLAGPNVWPNVENCPSMTNPNAFQTTMETYFEQLQVIARQVLQLLAASLDLSEHFFDPYFSDPIALLRLLHYESTISNPEAGIYGCGAHTDYGLLTILYTKQPGLEIHVDGQWRKIPARPHCFIVNLGDMLARWTNDVYHSTLHRVINTSGCDRYSMAFFFEPNFDTLVKCLPGCCSEDCPPLYQPIVSGQHLLNMYQQTHADFAASLQNPKGK